MNDLESNLNNLLVEIFHYILRYEEASLKALSNIPVTVSEAHILEVIGNHDNKITVSEIASTLSITNPTATVAIKKLEKKGFVTKASCTKDARKFIIALTPLGEKINKAHELFHKKMVKSISRGLSEAERDALMSAVIKLSEFFKEKTEVPQNGD